VFTRGFSPRIGAYRVALSPTSFFLLISFLMLSACMQNADLMHYSTRCMTRTLGQGHSCFSDCSSKYQFHCSVSSWQTWHKMLTLLFHGSADAKSFQSTYSMNIAEQQFLLWAQTYMAYLMYAYCYCFTLLGHVCFCCIWFSFFSVLCWVIGWEKPAWNNLFVRSFAVYSFRFFALLFTEWKCAVFIATSVLWM